MSFVFVLLKKIVVLEILKITKVGYYKWFQRVDVAVGHDDDSGQELGASTAKLVRINISIHFMIERQSGTVYGWPSLRIFHLVYWKLQV